MNKNLTRGFARNVDEAEFDASSVAAPIRASSGEVVAAISVAGPTLRFGRDTLGRLTAATVQTAGDISARLGYQRGP